MSFEPFLIPGATTMAILAIVYLLFVFWVRRPGRHAMTPDAIEQGS